MLAHSNLGGSSFHDGGKTLHYVKYGLVKFNLGILFGDYYCKGFIYSDTEGACKQDES